MTSGERILAEMVGRGTRCTGAEPQPGAGALREALMHSLRARQRKASVDPSPPLRPSRTADHFNQ